MLKIAVPTNRPQAVSNYLNALSALDAAAEAGRYFDPDDFDLYDLYYLLKTPHKITFMYDDEPQNLESVMEGDECTVCFNGKWYHSRDDFFRDACIDDTKITEIFDEFWGFMLGV